eukprot:360804-Chlamydomonas_euryale.AAC.9
MAIATNACTTVKHGCTQGLLDRVVPGVREGGGTWRVGSSLKAPLSSHPLRECVQQPPSATRAGGDDALRAMMCSAAILLVECLTPA